MYQGSLFFPGLLSIEKSKQGFLIMLNTISKKSFSSVLKTAAGIISIASVASALAAETVGSPVTASATLTFSEPVVFTHTLTPVSGLEATSWAGIYAIANGVVEFSSGATDSVALTFGAGGYESGLLQADVLKGTNNSDNTLTVWLANSALSADQTTVVAGGTGGIPTVFTTMPVKDNRLSYSILPKTGSVIPADSYNVSVTAYAYVS